VSSQGPSRTFEITICDLKHRARGRRYLPFAFTEHGTLMAANVLNSERAIEMRAAPWAAREKPAASLPD